MVLRVVAALGLMLALPAAAGDLESWPVRPIQWLLPGAAGSPPDFVARIVSERLAAALGQPVVVENRPGASGTIELATLAKAAPDGYTLGMITLPQTAAPALFRKLSYDTAKDFAPVAQLVWTPLVLCVRPGLAARSVGELVAAAKARPGELTYSSPGNGTLNHLDAELFRFHAGVDIRHIPFRSGPPALAALVAGQVDMMFTTPAAAAGQASSGKLRILAATAPRRLAQLADVPTMSEAGFGELSAREWYTIVAPAQTPRAIVERVAAEVRRTLSAPDTHDRLANAGYDPVTDSGPREAGALIQSELKRWQAVVREAGIHGD